MKPPASGWRGFGRFLLAIPLLAFLAGCSRAAPPPEPARPVLTRVLGDSTGDEVRTYSGEVRSRYETALAFRIAGKISARLVDTGAVVRAGFLTEQRDWLRRAAGNVTGDPDRAAREG